MTFATFFLGLLAGLLITMPFDAANIFGWLFAIGGALLSSFLDA